MYFNSRLIVLRSKLLYPHFSTSVFPLVPGESEILKFHSRRALSDQMHADYRPPHFISKPTVYKVKVGSSITLSCEAVNLGKSLQIFCDNWSVFVTTHF